MSPVPLEELEETFLLHLQDKGALDVVKVFLKFIQESRTTTSEPFLQVQKAFS